MTSSYDPDSLRLKGRDPTPIHRTTLPPRHRPGELFLKGPIPWNWLSAAARCGGKALHVTLVLWLESCMKRTREVKLSRRHLLSLGVLRDAGSRGLDKLEKAGLVQVTRLPGCSPRVRLLDVPDATLGTKPEGGVLPGHVDQKEVGDGR